MVSKDAPTLMVELHQINTAEDVQVHADRMKTPDRFPIMISATPSHMIVGFPGDTPDSARKVGEMLRYIGGLLLDDTTPVITMNGGLSE